MTSLLKTHIAQWIIDRAIDEPQSRGNYVLMRAVRRVLLGLGFDPLITYSIGGSRLFMPFSHELPFYRAAHPEYAEHLRRIAGYLRARTGTLVMIDIGANVGDSIALVTRDGEAEVLAVEPNPKYVEILNRNVREHDRVTVDDSILGRSGAALAQVTSDRKGSGRLTSGGSVSPIPLAILLRRFPNFQNASLLKIDTDGYDSEIVSGAIDWISIAMPTIVAEFDPDLTLLATGRLPSIVHQLSDVGYRWCLIYENTGEYVECLDLQSSTDVDALLVGRYLGAGGRRYADLVLFHETTSLEAMEFVRMENQAMAG